MGCGVYWTQIKELDRALGALREGGISKLSAPYQQLYALRGKLFGQLGWKFPRLIQFIWKFGGLSPGTIKLWLDVESGWMTEARERPGAPPVHRYVSDEIAVAILKEELTHDQFTELTRPDDYLGE